MSDNTTTVNYINKQGGKKELCNQVTRRIWEWAIARDIWLIATYIPGLLNTRADKQSRIIHANIEWSLKEEKFLKIEETFGKREIDLFASRLNNKTDWYVSWMPDPNAKHCDAFSLSWKNLKAYIFPPFSLISRILRKVEQEKCRDIVLLAPEWPTQAWYTKLLKMSHAIIFLPNSVLFNPVSTAETRPRGRLMCCHITQT